MEQDTVRPFSTWVCSHVDVGSCAYACEHVHTRKFINMWSTDVSHVDEDPETLAAVGQVLFTFSLMLSEGAHP